MTLIEQKLGAMIIQADTELIALVHKESELQLEISRAELRHDIFETLRLLERLSKTRKKQGMAIGTRRTVEEIAETLNIELNQFYTTGAK